MLDETHDGKLRSWVTSANDPLTDFPVQNLPFGRFRRAGTDEPPRVGVAIGDQVLDLKLAFENAPWNAEPRALLKPLAEGRLNGFMALGAQARRDMRGHLSRALREGSESAPFLELCLVPRSSLRMALPCRIGNYTDFQTSIHHATAVGKLLSPQAPLAPSYKWMPIGYHGRASSVGVSGLSIRRPLGQLKGEGDAPTFGPTRCLDYALELGAFIGAANRLGSRVPMTEAEGQLFGMTLLNDWAALDIHAWESQPLGPFMSKNFASTVSPWIVTMEALAPFRSAPVRPAGDPEPLPHLDSAANRAAGAIDIQLEVWLQTETMERSGVPPLRLTQSNFVDAYWTLAQLVAHHTSNGCNLQVGDLLGTGTQSGPFENQGGSLLELSRNGKRPITLPNGETRSFLLDGDTVILRAACEREGFARIGFGNCTGRVVPSV